jgi:hypothetical protein
MKPPSQLYVINLEPPRCGPQPPTQTSQESPNDLPFVGATPSLPTTPINSPPIDPLDYELEPLDFYSQVPETQQIASPLLDQEESLDQIDITIETVDLCITTMDLDEDIVCESPVNLSRVDSPILSQDLDDSLLFQESMEEDENVVIEETQVIMDSLLPHEDGSPSPSRKRELDEPCSSSSIKRVKTGIYCFI